ncbi:hypothetical protein HJG52_05200 [Knoellia sp. DB2414S]|uniref:Ankyrin repeat domain-containing protein n=2 Tax=Knoellia koreensis TaxID=2730921 RepID=A0A849HGL2_9MICO|nr:hypothetical protein [Knoellia sp. DB2414S]
MDLAALVISRDMAGLREALARGEDVDSVDRRGFTALHVAAQQHELEAMRELLRAGANIDARNAYGNTFMGGRLRVEGAGRRDPVVAG